jgi:hypothetical protein
MLCNTIGLSQLIDSNFLPDKPYHASLTTSFSTSPVSKKQVITFRDVSSPFVASSMPYKLAGCYDCQKHYPDHD